MMIVMVMMMTGPSVNLSARMNEPLTNRECLEQRAVCISQDGDIYIATTSILALNS